MLLTLELGLHLQPPFSRISLLNPRHPSRSIVWNLEFLKSLVSRNSLPHFIPLIPILFAALFVPNPRSRIHPSLRPAYATSAALRSTPPFDTLPTTSNHPSRPSFNRTIMPPKAVGKGGARAAPRGVGKGKGKGGGGGGGGGALRK